MEEKDKKTILSRIKSRIAATKAEKGDDYYDIERKKYIKSLTLAYQLGYYVGEDITMRFMPSLTYISMIETNVQKRITEEERDKYRELDDKWYETNSKEDFDIQLKYYKSLEKKYFPKVLKCYFDPINIPDEAYDDFIKGLQHALWNSDCCAYSTKKEDIKIYLDEYYKTIIELKYKD